MRESLGDKMDLETRLDPETNVAKHVVILHGTRSRNEVQQMIALARHRLRDDPRPIDAVELALDKAGVETVTKAIARRRARFG